MLVKVGRSTFAVSRGWRARRNDRAVWGWIRGLPWGAWGARPPTHPTARRYWECRSIWPSVRFVTHTSA